MEHLEAREVKCWIAPRDVPLGGNYAEEILKAIEVSKILVVLYSEHASLSKHVYREVERAIKHDVIIAPVRTDRSNVTGPLSYFLATTQWVDAFEKPMEGDLERAADRIAGLFQDDTVLSPKPGGDVEDGRAIRSKTAAAKFKPWMLYTGSALFLAGLVAAIMTLFPLTGAKGKEDFQPGPAEVYSMNDEEIILHESPSLHSARIGSFRRGAKVMVEEVIEEEKNGQTITWARICFDPGWVAVKNENEPDFELVVPVGTKEFNIGHTAMVNYAGSDGLNLRESPNYESAVLGKLLHGTRMTIANNEVKAGTHLWRQVEIDSGWIELTNDEGEEKLSLIR